MIMKRKEGKNYGTKQMIEGIYKPGCKALVLEDVMSSGSSVLETVTVSTFLLSISLNVL